MAAYDVFHNVNRLTEHKSGGLVLSNLSTRAMAEIKGPGVRDWLSHHGFITAEQIDRAYVQDDKTVVGLLAANNVLFLKEDEGHAAQGSRLPLFGTGKVVHDGVYPLPRFQGSYWFRLSGSRSADMMSMLCSVDLRPHRFADLQIAKTMMVGTTVFIIRQDHDNTLAYHLIGDLSYTSYLWPTLTAAMKKFSDE